MISKAFRRKAAHRDLSAQIDSWARNRMSKRGPSEFAIEKMRPETSQVIVRNRNG